MVVDERLLTFAPEIHECHDSFFDLNIVERGVLLPLHHNFPTGLSSQIPESVEKVEIGPRMGHREAVGLQSFLEDGQ